MNFATPFTIMPAPPEGAPMPQVLHVHVHVHALVISWLHEFAFACICLSSVDLYPRVPSLRKQFWDLHVCMTTSVESDFWLAYPFLSAQLVVLLVPLWDGLAARYSRQKSLNFRRKSLYLFLRLKPLIRVRI